MEDTIIPSDMPWHLLIPPHLPNAVSSLASHGMPSMAYQKPFHIGFLLTLVSEIMFIFQLFFDSEDLLGINEENDLTGVKGVSMKSCQG